MARKKKADGTEAEEAETRPAAKAPAVAATVPSVGEQPKAKAKPKAKPKAEPKAEGAEAPVAKVSAEPKAKADAKAKAEPKAKADAKAKPEPKAKAEVKAKAEPKPKAPAAATPAVAETKAKAKPKAKEAPPAKAAAPPLPQAAGPDAADAADAGMEAVARKRRGRKKKAEAEEPAAEPQELVAAGPTDEDLADSERIRSEHDKHHNDLYEKLRKELDALPDLGRHSGEEVTKDIVEQRKALEKIMAEVDETLRGVKITRPKNVNTSKIMKQMRELRICKDDGTFTEETKKLMLEELERALSQSLGYHSFKNFQTTMQTLKAQCEERLKQNEELAKNVRSGNMQRRIVQRVAASKGVKAEDLNPDAVVNVNVDLPPEVTSLNFLYRPKFEKQFGVVIDRPDGSKGSGKGGPQPPPKMLIIRGIEPEVSACAQAMKALDLSDRKVLTVTAKQAAAIMGPQQANARKIEQDFKVFLYSERNLVTIHGSAKEVAACLTHIRALMPEESATTGATSGSGTTPLSSALTMSIDKDTARALIGANGKNVQKIETETSTKIKVNIMRNDEEDLPATVKITGDKANQEKARDQINSFLKSLAVCLVEAEPDVVSRLYDSAVKGKGKGKGKTGGDGRPSKFAELRDNSGLTVVKKAKGVLLVGDKESVEKWKVSLEECMEEAASLPATVKLSFEQVKLWSPERLEAVQSSTGAQLQLSRRTRETVLEILGTEAEKEKARTEILKMHDDMGCVETIENVSADGVKSLTAKGAGRVREVEQAHGVSIVVDRKTQAVRIVGAEGSVDKAKKAVQSVLSSAATATQKEVEIGQYEGRLIIGRGGATVRKIKQDSGIDDLQVEDGDHGKKVILRGSDQAVEAAVQLVQEVLANARNPSAAAPATTHAVEEASAPAEGGEAVTAGGDANDISASSTAEDKHEEVAQAAPAGEVEVDRRPEAPKKGYGKVFHKPDVNLESKELFPTLGSSNSSPMGGKKSKRQPKNTAWKTVEDEEKAAEEEEEEEEAGGEEAAVEADADAEADDGEEPEQKQEAT